MTEQDPKAMLETATHLERNTRGAAANDRGVLIGWAIWIAVFIPPFDFLNNNAWGPVVMVAGIAGGLTTYRHYQGRASKVRSLQQLSPWFWAAWGVYYAIVILASSLFKDHLSYAHALAAILALVPLIGAALRLNGARN